MPKEIKLVDSVGAVQMSNGVVRLYFVAQDPTLLSQGVDPQQVKPELAEVVAMPLPGFLYAVKVIENFLKDEKMQKILNSGRDAAGGEMTGEGVGDGLASEVAVTAEGEEDVTSSKRAADLN